MVENVKTQRAIVKEIQIDKGVFSLKSEKSNKFSASESYKENMFAGKLPIDAPGDFKDAIPNIYYVPENRELISYTELHHKIAQEKELLLNSNKTNSDDDKKKAHIESSKKVLKESGINDKTLLVYSPKLTQKLNDETDEFSEVSVTYDHGEKVLFVKTILLPRERPKPNFDEDLISIAINIPEENHEVQEELIAEPESETETIYESEPEAIPFEPESKPETIQVSEPEVISPEPEEEKPVNEVAKVEEEKAEELTEEKTVKKETSKADIEELKKKYKFQRPPTESISETIKKRSKKGATTKETSEEEIKQEKALDPEEELKKLISDALHNLPGTWEDNIFKVNFKETGYLVPVEKVELKKDRIIVSSSCITNIEWWNKTIPIDQCKRFKGALEIPDDFAPFCLEAKCSEACGAEDGFVELSAARFRLVEEKEIIKNDFKRLQSFFDRAFRLMDEFKGTFEVDLHLETDTKSPYLYAVIERPSDESVLRKYFEAFLTIYPEITDIRGKMDIEDSALNEDFDPISEDGLVQESRNYGVQEMIRRGSIDLLNDIIKQKDGTIEGNFYLIERGRMRFILKPTRIEAVRDELYMGNVNFKKGLKEVQNFIVTTLGGGRW